MQQLESSLRQWVETPGTSTALTLLETAEKTLSSGKAETSDAGIWHRYLDETRRPRYLQALPGREQRYRWAETTFSAVRASEYTLGVLLGRRVAEHPERALFQELVGGEVRSWSYATIARKLRSVAAAFLSTQAEPPRVVIASENSLDSACCDLACLVYDIFVTPVNPHFNRETLAWIVNTLEINIVVVESEDLRERFDSVATLAKKPFHLFILDPDVPLRRDDETRLGETCALLSQADVEQILAERPSRRLDDVATAMFTSGSTGMPKGVQYTSFNLITKRFARAAALPKVGTEEVLLCFLPLYHTFGRYLEMTGMLFWGGTYTFAGNPSFGSLLTGLREVRPTGLISVPRRWEQIRERCLQEMGSMAERASQEEAFQRIVGPRLSWGLSAAGALEPKVFHFFQRHGVDLCSGFGMTEATGGITMTPPSEYEDDTVGVPLPGVEARLSELGELEISGPYVARYLDEPEPPPGKKYWLPTGDIFRQRPSGYYEIVDRIKDIYKNTKGQTVAPGAIEHKLSGVPGIKRSFVVGDGRAYNVVLIVPDADDPVLKDSSSAESTSEYFRQIVTTANHDLAPYERVVNFAVLDRDFDIDLGELTSKGSFRRKAIEDHFADTIEQLYKQDFVELAPNGYRVRIPRWFYRDLGILETAIVEHPDGLYNRRSRRFLAVVRHGETETVEIGDLEYKIDGNAIDLGLMALQPLLWLANPSLIAFCPCKEGWDHPLGPVSPQVFIPWRKEGECSPAQTVTPTSIRDPVLTEINHVCTIALFGRTEDALQALQGLSGALDKANRRIGGAILRRLEALARHPSFEARCLAYQIFLLKGTLSDYGRQLPAFLVSGLPFLSEESVHAISQANIDRHRLDALRERLHRYRTELAWPTTAGMREQFKGVFSLLESFVQHHPGFYASIRAELVSWALHEADPELLRSAQKHLGRLVEWFEAHLEETTRDNGPEHWSGRIVFQDRITRAEKEFLEKALVGTTFLKQSTMLAFDDEGVEIQQIPKSGIWISRVFSFLHHRLYRISVNTKSGRHFDLLLAVLDDMNESSVLETTYWMIALTGRVGGPPVVRQFGCYRPELGALSMALVSDLTVWERVREFAGGSFVEFLPSKKHWRNLFVRGMSAFFLGWLHSDRRISPGPVTPENVVVPAPDYRSDVKILSLTHWESYKGPPALIQPMIKNFYLQTLSNYPSSRKDLEIQWIFDACVEALGAEEGERFLRALEETLDEEDFLGLGEEVSVELSRYVRGLETAYHLPLPLQCGIERYGEWIGSNPRATASARERQVGDLHRLYSLDRFGDIARYTLYRHTYFTDAGAKVQEAFDRLLNKMFLRPNQRPTHMVELSDLQAALTHPEDLLVFTRLVFPTAHLVQPVDVVRVGEQETAHVVVSSHVIDNRGESYTVHETVKPAEIGKLYRLFLDAGMPMSLDEQERYYMVIDKEERVVGGLCYKLLEPAVARLDGLVVAGSLKARGLAGELLEDFCQRMGGQGVRTINTLFVSRDFYIAHGFHVDEGWGGLVRFLREDAKTEVDMGELE